MKIFPAKIDFFDYLDKAVENANNCTLRLVELVENFHDAEKKVKEIYEIEQEGDLLTHDIMRKLNQTFITPIDREDLHALASSIDDVVDMIWSAVDRMIVFRIEEPTPEAIHISKALHETTKIVMKAFKELKSKNWEHVKEHCIDINRMENQIDRIYRNALGELFDDFKDSPAMLIKWKDVYDHLEEASDKCEDVANILESIVLKHA